jgi:multiple sugar transport system substrate-binding protein
VLKDANPKAKDFVTYMMSDGYLPWLGIAPEGKMPARSGTSGNPKEYSDGWIKLSAGVDKREPLTTIYPAEVLNTIVASSGNFERWGIPQNQGALAAAVAQQYVVPQALAKMLNSGASAADATNEAQKGAEQVQKDLGG